MTSRAERIKAARSTSCALYHAQVSRDEAWAYLGGDDWDQWRSRWTIPPALQVHHIFGRGSEDHEQRANLIMVSACAHSWGHDRCPNEFRLACLYAKWEKRTGYGSLVGIGPQWDNPETVSEFDVPTLEKLTGVPLVGWLEGQALKVEGAYREYAEEMIRWLRSTGSCCSAT